MPVPCEKSVRSFGELCSTSVIIVEHAAQDISPLDWTSPRRAWHERNGTALINTLMWSRTIVVVDIRRENPLQMAVLATCHIQCEKYIGCTGCHHRFIGYVDI